MNPSEEATETSVKNVKSRDEYLLAPYVYSAEQITGLLDVDVLQGLSSKVADARLNTDGPNTMEAAVGISPWRILLGQFSSIVVWLLAFAAIVAWLTDSQIEAIAILVVLILNALIGFAIEWRAGRALDALRKATHTMARVRRNGSEHVIDASELVSGDIVILTAGDRVPADSLLIESVNLQADESTLTGESVPSEKNNIPVEISAPLAERSSMLYLGTNIARGRAVAIVTATGTKTEIGRIGQLINQTRSEQTPLERKLQELGTKLVYVVLGVAAIVMVAGVLRGSDWWLMLKVSVSLAVAAVPEGLPAVTTLILALGVLRMARHNAIVRKLSAVETLGSTTVICSDKTGTLTENRMTVQEFRLANGQVIQLSANDGTSLPDANLDRLLRVSILCNEASFNPKNADGKQMIGDPTETALLVAADGLGSNVQTERATYKNLYEHPFDATTKRMEVVSQAEDGRQFASMKGAPGVLLDACNSYISQNGNTNDLDDEKRRTFLEINESMASRELRVLAFAEKPLNGEVDFSSNDELKIDEVTSKGYTFLGFAGMIDPLREGVVEAVRKAQQAGIRVIMLTGDQLNTARAVARELNLNEGFDLVALHSDDLVASDSEKIARMAREAQVFARVTPEDKLRIVEALQKAGEIVAVTGDGVNDAPALKRADIGIAMGMRGTEVAKEAADIVLTDDNFSTIVKAVESGRSIYANITKFVHMMFSHNLGEVLVIFVPIAAGFPLPLFPLQILWINLVTDIFPALALAVEPPSLNTMTRGPLSASENLLSKPFLILIAWQGVMLAIITLAVYFWALQTYGDGAHTRTVTLLAVVGSQLGHLYNCRSRTQSAFNGFFRNPYIFAATGVVVVLQIFAIYFEPLARVLDTVRPTAIDLGVILIALFAPIAIVEIVKVIDRRRSPG
ncbi:MAG: calcium-translocating P-type ATPase, PMCA-type [bacterium]|nr:calcium-translocating P-type ATPase, PMCA-type [bacterium]